MAVTRLSVEPSVLRWARETAGLDVATAAARVGVKQDKVERWEEGSLAPTINQIRTMADAYARPLAALFMTEPPAEDVKRDLPDFRRPEVRSHVVSRTLQKAMMRAYRQRDALRDVAESLELPESDVTAKYALNQALDPAVLGEQLRAALDIGSISKTVLLQPDVFLRELVRRAESLNVTVIQVQRVDVTEMRGFSLGDGPCPIVALNGADWPRGKVYTLLHELAHVGFRSNGLCDLQLLKATSLSGCATPLPPLLSCQLKRSCAPSGIFRRNTSPRIWRGQSGMSSARAASQPCSGWLSLAERHGTTTGA